MAPTSAASLLAAATAMGGLAGSGGTTPFLGALAGYALLHALGLLRLRRLYVFAHEFTHALAVWLSGGKVYRFVVRADSGHVDLSHTSVFVALAPYWIPLPSLLVIVSYRFVLWIGNPPHARGVFLALMGFTLAFHFAHTVESLWTTRQSDLDEAGLVLSLSLIALLNGIVVLLALKCLFPGLVALSDGFRNIAAFTASFWRGAAGMTRIWTPAAA